MDEVGIDMRSRTTAPERAARASCKSERVWARCSTGWPSSAEITTLLANDDPGCEACRRWDSGRVSALAGREHRLTHELELPFDILHDVPDRLQVTGLTRLFDLVGEFT